MAFKTRDPAHTALFVNWVLFVGALKEPYYLGSISGTCLATVWFNPAPCIQPDFVRLRGSVRPIPSS